MVAHDFMTFPFSSHCNAAMTPQLLPTGHGRVLRNVTTATELLKSLELEVI
jgi:hypothetical protein